LFLGGYEMKKLCAAFLSGLAISSLAVMPAFADGDGVLSVVVGMPLKGASVATAMVVGVPVAIARKTAQNTKEQTKKVAGDSSNPVMTGFAALVGVPIGLVSGTIDGSQAGFKNSIKCDKAFTKEQFSMGDLD
jgi:hypothetical protein